MKVEEKENDEEDVDVEKGKKIGKEERKNWSSVCRITKRRKFIRKRKEEEVREKGLSRSSRSSGRRRRRRGR